ncbi:MAG: hypothetical protein QOJ55_2171, partial [Solirubrobacteraceae bacterium]|nr:hypothetical protein [Solirubrobacteraceae bacterium]
MTPFLQFRLWWRRGSSGDRLAAVMAAAIAVVLAAWVLVPTTDQHRASTGVEAGAAGAATTVAPGPGVGTAAGAAGTAAAPGSAGTPAGANSAAAGAPSAGGGAAQPGAAAAGGGRVCPAVPSGAPGVTDKTIAVAVALLDLAGPIGNSAAGQASADDQQKVAQAVINDINSRGGAGCRQLAAKFYKLNPIGADQGRSGCLQIIQDRPALVLDLGGFAFPQSAYLCIPQQKVPLITASVILTSEATKFAPYLATPAPDLGSVVRDAAFGLRDFGWFDPAKGFKKLGLLYDECAPEVNKGLDEALAKAGITADQTSKYSFSCPPNGFAVPSDMAQAVSQHRLAGVTHVIPLTGGGAFKEYTEAAERQGFRPKYAINDYQGNTVTATSSLQPNGDNFDGSLAMSLQRFGINTTPGFALDPATKR